MVRIGGNGSLQKFLEKKMYGVKNVVVYERLDDGLFSYAFISISEFPTEIDHFLRGAGWPYIINHSNCLN
jgi:hypothetical protein